MYIHMCVHYIGLLFVFSASVIEIAVTDNLSVSSKYSYKDVVPYSYKIAEIVYIPTNCPNRRTTCMYDFKVVGGFAHISKNYVICLLYMFH
jgi:hypothetical protein